MKKTFVFVAAVTCAFAVSCNKSEQPSAVREIQTLTASVPSDDLSRVSADGVHVLWNQGDRLSLFDGGAASAGAVYETAVSEPSSTAVFTGTGAQLIDGKYYAFYPNDPDWLVSWNKDGDGKLRYAIPQIQYARVNNFPKNGVPMIASGTAESLTFRHLAGYVSFEIGDQSPDNIVKVIVGGGGATYCCGRFTVDYKNEGKPGFLDGTSNSIVLCNEDNSPLQKGVYYIAVRPRIWKGISLSFEDSEGRMAEVSASGDIKLDVGHLQRLGEVKNLSFSESAQVGDIYEEGGVKTGIVVSVSANSYKVMSLQGDSLPWAPASITALPSALASHRDDGSINTATIKSWDNYSTENYPAVAYCDAMGDGWYLPGSTEVMSLMANMGFAENEKYLTFDKKITDAGGLSLGENNTIARFWCSDTNADGSQSYYAYFKDVIKSNIGARKSSRGVRCVKKINN